MKKIKAEIPNIITLINLLCGCLGILAIFKGDGMTASLMIGLAAVADFFDGFAARLLKVSSPLGKELDSLADMVSFGVLPGFILYDLLEQDIEHLSANFNFSVSYFALLIPLFSAYRLAKFNIDTRQSDSFIGVPTPTNAMFVASFYPILNAYEGIEMIENILLNDYFLIGYCLIMSYLLISELPLIALKFKTFAINENLYRYILIGGALVLGIAFQYLAIPMVLVLYILLSVIQTLAHNK